MTEKQVLTSRHFIASTEKHQVNAPFNYNCQYNNLLPNYHTPFRLRCDLLDIHSSSGLKPQNVHIISMNG